MSTEVKFNKQVFNRNNYQKIIDNASAFIQAGGFATWQFVPYAHNEHQVKNCIKVSQELGFKKFKLIVSKEISR